MPLRAVESESLADKVFEQLAGEIVQDRYAAGESIPGERELSTVFAVNRHVVREAVKRLEQVGLVKVAQGGRTRVQDFRRTAGLDLLSVLAQHSRSAEVLGPLLVSALEMRCAIGADLARLCAERATADVAEDLLAIAEQLAQEHSDADLFALDQRFWERMLDGAANMTYQLAFNSLIAAVHAIPELTAPWLRDELARTDWRRPIAQAIAARDAQAAERSTREALAPHAAALVPMFERQEGAA